MHFGRDYRTAFVDKHIDKLAISIRPMKKTMFVIIFSTVRNLAFWRYNYCNYRRLAVNKKRRIVRCWGKIYSFFLAARKIEPFLAYLFLEADKTRIKPYRDRTIELESNLRYNKVFYFIASMFLEERTLCSIKSTSSVNIGD